MMFNRIQNSLFARNNQSEQAEQRGVRSNQATTTAVDIVEQTIPFPTNAPNQNTPDPISTPRPPIPSQNTQSSRLNVDKLSSEELCNLTLLRNYLRAFDDEPSVTERQHVEATAVAPPDTKLPEASYFQACVQHAVQVANAGGASEGSKIAYFEAIETFLNNAAKHPGTAHIANDPLSRIILSFSVSNIAKFEEALKGFSI